MYLFFCGECLFSGLQVQITGELLDWLANSWLNLVNASRVWRFQHVIASCITRINMGELSQHECTCEGPTVKLVSLQQKIKYSKLMIPGPLNYTTHQGRHISP